MYNTDLPTRAELPSSKQLLRSTVLAILTAGTLLITTVLPSEYGIDPTGIGRVLGLTAMGEVKVSLAQEAQQNESAVVAKEAVVPTPGLTAVSDAATPALTPATAGQTHQMTIQLAPGEAAEVKLAMNKGAKVAFQWTADGPLNVDAHGDPLNPPANFYHGYGKARQIKAGQGEIQAAFDGKHGWFWRNRSDEAVTLRLNTKGEYQTIKRVL